MDYSRIHDAAPDDVSGRRWMNAPAVAAARTAAQRARAAWNATGLPFGATGPLTEKQRALRGRMEATDLAYVAARDEELYGALKGR